MRDLSQAGASVNPLNLTCPSRYGAATYVVTLWASSEAAKELLVTVTAPSSLSFLLLEVVYLCRLVKPPPMMAKRTA